MPLIAIASPKGGVGKTTITAHLAAILAARGHRVTVLDLDPQNALRLHMGVSIREQGGFMARIRDRPDWRSSLHHTECGAQLLPFGMAEPVDVLDIATALGAEPGLLADPVQQMLRDPDLTLHPLLLGFHAGDAITGFAMAVMSKGNPIEPPMLEILDLVALKDEPRAILALMEALLKNARMLGAAKVRIQTVNDDLLERLGPLVRSAKHEGGWGHCHVRFEPGTPGIETWAPTPFDGDYGICLRPVPVEAVVRRAA